MKGTTLTARGTGEQRNIEERLLPLACPGIASCLDIQVNYLILTVDILFHSCSFGVEWFDVVPFRGTSTYVS